MAQKFLSGIDISGNIVVDSNSAVGVTVLDIQGTQGQLFSLTNSLSGDLFSVSDISGIPILNVNSSGIVTVDGNLNLGDNDKIQFGASQDLKIYHDGSNSYIEETGTGRLILSGGSDIQLQSPAGELMGDFTGNGSVDLYYNNSKKFETTNIGVTVTGTVTANGTVLTGDQTLPTASSLGAVTLTGTQTISGTKTFTSTGNYHNGHLYYTAYDAAGNHYPHFLDGSSNGGTTVNWRQYYGTTYKNHTWASDGSGNMVFTYQGAIKAVGEIEATSLDINGNADISGNLSGVDTYTGENIALTIGASGSGRRDPFTALHTSNNTITISQFGLSHADSPAANQIGVSNAEQHLHLITDTQANIQAGTSLKGIFLRSGGSVGIGTKTPSAKLDVAGGIEATSLDINGAADISGDLTLSGGNIYNSTGSLVIQNNAGAQLDIKSNQGVRLYIDKNNDDTTRNFEILANTDTYNANNVVATVSQLGNATFAGTVTANGTVLTNQSDFVSAANGGTFSGNIDLNASFKWAKNQSNSYTYSAADASGMYIERFSTAGAGSALADMRFQARNNNSGTYNSIRIKGSDNTVVITSPNTIISGNLTVNGTQTILNTETVEVEDNIIVLNKTASDGSATAATSGIAINRGGTTANASLIFDDADDFWDLTHNLKVAGNSSIGGYVEATSYLYLRDNIRLLNKAANNWLTFATRNTAASEAVYDLANVGTLTAAGEIEGGSLDINGNADISGNLTGVDNSYATTFRAANNESYYGADASGTSRRLIRYGTDDHVYIGNGIGELYFANTGGTRQVFHTGHFPTYSEISGTVPTWNQNTTGNAATATNSTQLNGFTLDRIDNAEAFHTFTGINAASAQAKRYHIGRLYGCPAHWDGNWQNMDINVTAESYESGHLRYRLMGDYGGAGSQSGMMDLYLKEASGPMVPRFRFVLGTPVDAGWDHSGQDTFYVDLYAEASHYSQWEINIKTYGHGTQNTNPTSGGATTVLYDSPTVTNITTFTEDHSTITHLGHEIYHEGHLPTLTELGAQAAGTYSTATGVSNNADVTPSWVPSSDPSYLTSSSTQSKYIRSDVADSASGRISFNGCDTNNHDTIATSTGSLGAMEIYNNGAGKDAFMTFHVGSDFACYFGLDGGTNKLSVGGWSMGAASYEIYHAGNLPSLATLGAQAAGTYLTSDANYLKSNADDIFTGILEGNRSGENLKVSGIRGQAKGSQTGEYIHLYERVHIGGPSGWGHSSHTAPSQGLGIHGGLNVGQNGSGVISMDDTTIVTAARALTNISDYGLASADIPDNAANTTGTAASSAKLTDGGTLTTHPGQNNLLYTGQISAGTAGLFATSDNSNSVITLNRHNGEYNSQLGFSSNGYLYYRKKSNTANNTQAWKVLAFTDSDITGNAATASAVPYSGLTGTVPTWNQNTTGSAGSVAWGNITSRPYIDTNSTTSATATTAIASVAHATYTAAFFDFVIKNGTNVRAGTIYACHDGTNVEFTETSTVDLGDTSDVTLNVVISTSYLQLQATTTSSTWTIKSLIRAI